MSLPAFGRLLVDHRRACKPLPWLVVVALGVLGDRDTLRGVGGVMRLGLAADAAGVDWSLLLGLNVLLSYFEPEGFTAAERERWFLEAERAIWTQGQPGTLWMRSGVRAKRLVPFESPRHGLTFTTFDDGVPLTAGLRAHVESARQTALMRSEGIFARREFDPARAHELERLLGPRHVVTARDGA